MSGPLKGAGARTLETALRKLGKTTQRTAANAVRVSINQANAFYMSFDETESLPYVKGENGMITVSGKGLADDTSSVDEVLARQTQIAADTMETQLQLGLKEFLK